MERREIYLAGGCFWGVEKYLSLIPGVLETDVGYANGTAPLSGEEVSYERVCRGDTGYAETVKVVYDGSLLLLDELLRRFFEVVDPTSVNKQGNDVGDQYRSGIYYTDADDLPAIQAVLRDLAKKYEKPIAVETGPLKNYVEAEEYHQKYLDKNPGGYCHIPSTAFAKAGRELGKK